MSKPQFLKLYHQVWDLGLPPPEFSVFTYLLKFGDRCYPSHKIIAENTKLSLTSVKKALKALKGRGLVHWEQGHTHWNNRYTVLWVPGGPAQPAGINDSTSPAHANSNSSQSDLADLPDAAPMFGMPDHQFSSSKDFLTDLGFDPESEQ